jgi:hypothetical protein
VWIIIHSVTCPSIITDYLVQIIIRSEDRELSRDAMRRSFATNYFGKIETPILMEITGHSRESTFLSYIGENPNKDAVADVFMERLRRLGNEGG